MDQRLSLLLLHLFVSTHLAAATGTCGELTNELCAEPSDKNCATCDTDGILVPNPFDCRAFYVCNKATIAFDGKSFSCPDGQIFDVDTLQCVTGASCDPFCGAASGECLYTCAGSTKPDAMLADPYDCTIYYKCVSGVSGVASSCPSSTPHFDGASCQKEESRCCSCHAYCYAHDVDSLVADPKDCRRYHACFQEGAADFTGECPAGQYFDAHLRECSSTVPCITACKNVIGSDGCIDPYICHAEGYFAKCPSQCMPEYYHCTEISDEYKEVESCPDGYVFHPDNLVCVQNNTCTTG